MQLTILSAIFIILAAFAFTFIIPLFTTPVFALDCSQCAVGACVCNVTECVAGTLDVYATACTGIPTEEFIFSNSSFIWSKSQATNYYFQVYCDSGIMSSCTKVNLTFAAITTATTTTTAIQISACPRDCCVGELNYYDRYCGEGYDCIDNQCVSSTITTTSEAPSGPQISYSIVGVVVILIAFVIFLFYFLRGRKPEDKWASLYKKYGRR
jgi:hypothetical protein